MINPMSGKETHDIRKNFQELILPCLPLFFPFKKEAMPHFSFITLDLFSEKSELALIITMHCKALLMPSSFFLSTNQEILERQCDTEFKTQSILLLLHLNTRLLYVAGSEPMMSAQLTYHLLCSYL